MKKFLLRCAMIALVSGIPAAAQARVSVHLGIGVNPFIFGPPPPIIYSPPVYVQPPVYVPPPPPVVVPPGYYYGPPRYYHHPGWCNRHPYRCYRPYPY